MSQRSTERVRHSGGVPKGVRMASLHGTDHHGPNPFDVMRSLDVVQHDTALARGFADANAARATRKGIQVKYSRDQRSLRRELRTQAKTGNTGARSALRSMPKPHAGGDAWSKWSQQTGQRVPKAPQSRGPRPVAATPLQRAGSVAATGHRFLAKANPFLMAAAGIAVGSTAYNAARSHGSSGLVASADAAVAASPYALMAAAPTVIGRVAPGIASVMARAALPLTAALAVAGAVRGGYQAYSRGAGIGGVAGAAGLGAVDALTFGLASRGINALSAPAKTSPGPAMSGADKQRFQFANQSFGRRLMSERERRGANQQEASGTGKHRGWSPEARIAAAQARGAKNLPYGGDPTAAPQQGAM